MRRSLLPHPWLTLLLTLVWVLLSNTLSLGVVVFGLILGVITPIITAPYWPNRPVLRRPGRLAGYVLVVLWDILVANFVVAAKILFKSNEEMRPTWVTIPLELRKPEAITVLAGTITLTPGTVSADLSSDGRSLLVHCLDADDADAVRDEIKQRYEARLTEIFG